MNRKCREEAAERLRQRWKNPDYRARMAAVSSARIRAMNADPEISERRRERTSQRLKELHQDPAFRAKLKAGRDAYWARRRAESPRCALTPAERKLYDKIRRKLRPADLARDIAIAAVRAGGATRMTGSDIRMADILARLHPAAPPPANSNAPKRGAGPECNTGETVSRETPPGETGHPGASGPWRANVISTWSTEDLLHLYLLRFWSPLSTAEIAVILGKTDPAVRGKLHRLGWLTQPRRDQSRGRRSACR